MRFLTKHTLRPVSIAPLVTFRIVFGLVMAAGVVRFVAKGWVAALYLEPTFHFTYFGFGWVQPLGATGMYALFAVMGVAALAIALGWRYRIATVVFFLAFTYVELIDVTTYLNHYYFVSLVAFLLIWLPAHRRFSLDVRRCPALAVATVPAWTVNVLKVQIAVVYVFAGLAKLHPDWLFEAMPLRLWLPAHAHWPVLGGLLAEPVTAYVFSWAGALYDLFIVGFLLYGPTRAWAYAAVVGFHVTTALLFPIGLFPYLMIGATLLFFSAAFHERVLQTLHRWSDRLPLHQVPGTEAVTWRPGPLAGRGLVFLLGAYVVLQLVLPFRFALYPGDLFWTEQGYRFSWRVMLMEKAGHAVFRVHDPATGRTWEAANYEHLTPVQEKMMATQPDLLLQFAHHLEAHYRAQGYDDVIINADAYVTLNGRRSRRFIDPTVDLTTVRPGLAPKAWILPFEDRSPTAAR